MRNQYTLPMLFKSGYSLADIDAIARVRLGTFGKKTGKTVLVIADKVGADNFVADRRDAEYDRDRRR